MMKGVCNNFSIFMCYLFMLFQFPGAMLGGNVGPSQMFGPGGMQPNTMGVQRGLFMPQNPGFPGDVRSGWSGIPPQDFGNPPVIMQNGPPPSMGMGGPPNHLMMQGGPPMGMQMGGPGKQENFQSFRGGPGGMRGGGRGGRGNWNRPGNKRPPCKHFRNGHCRKGNDCPFLHVL